MVVLIPKFTGPQIGAALTVVGGTTALMWAFTSKTRDVRDESGGPSPHNSDMTNQLSRKDAVIAHPRPSVDARAKNSQPTASKFV